MNQTKEDTRAKGQAKAQLESIVLMMKRLEHSQECDGEDCKLTDQEILDGLGYSYEKDKQASDEERERYHNEYEARQTISEDPLSVEVRSDWHTPSGDSESTEYTILLCTGGPACRIIGELGQYNEPETAKIEYQHWFTPWIEYFETTEEENEALLTYAKQFYFGPNIR